MITSKYGYAPNLSQFDSNQVQFFDLANYQGSANGWQYDEKSIILCAIERCRCSFTNVFGHMKNLTYPHHLIDLAFLVSDSSDDTMGELKNI